VEAGLSAPKRRTRGRPGWVGAIGWLLLLLVSLSLVTWRQTRGLALEREVRELETAHAMKEAERVELTRRVEELRSRSRIVQVARDRLGMHLPQDSEIVFLPVAGVPRAEPEEEAP
jgi:cell division protein FtsL